MSKFGFKSPKWKTIHSLPRERRMSVWGVFSAKGMIINAFTSEDMAHEAANGTDWVARVSVWDAKVKK